MSGVSSAEETGLDDQVPFLARLEREDRIALLGLGRELRYQARDHLIHQAEPSAHILLLLGGWTKVTARAASGYVALLALRGPGDVIGESAALTGRPRSASVVALEPVHAVAVDHGRFRDYLTARPQAALRLLSLVSDRTRAADRRRLEYASLDVKERLAALLLELARSHGNRTERGIELTVPLSQEELAGSVGASSESVKKFLTELRREGVVATGRRSTVLLRPDVLRKICAANRT
ncbi:Crp/Fnr family transcriptional regulator [Streptomyces durbertensis]|uniref:Crp/Fnr family transcriptional regulator n=1 Tax=Streptomyces durbertensis TaxID=2448886 RepID=A0ABR6EE91_9ACTN|nr:Crp/Fnr family transcriptional regulator [Streptomyces durbertensis]MBB1243661.1 Crp/Fnr family transcriptional regulator [Streptomyces durbertensis]